jgi:soluble lytic murein transglycosylase-like protein
MRFAGFVLCFGFALPCLGGETIYLTTGFSFEAESHTVQGDTILARTGTGTLEFPKKEVGRIEAIPTVQVSKTSDVAETPHDLLTKAANGQGLEPELVESVAKIESGLLQNAVSTKGAIGLMQLMPATATELGAKATEADSNALGGAEYLRELLVRYDGNYALALAAYNAGPGAVAKYHGVPPYAETVSYITKVLREYKREKTEAFNKPSADR